MAVTDVNSVMSAYTASDGSANRTSGSDLGMNEFLELLAVQLSNQDPLEPMEDTDFIAQMAQFSSLEAMTALTESFASTQAYSLVGKNVVAQATVDGVKTEIYGQVAGTILQSGEQYLQIGDYLVTLGSVIGVYDGGESAGISEAANLIGKTITAEVPAGTTEEPDKTETVEGIVDYVLLKNDGLYVKLKDMDKEAPVAYITKIA